MAIRYEDDEQEDIGEGGSEDGETPRRGAETRRSRQATATQENYLDGVHALADAIASRVDRPQTQSEQKQRDEILDGINALRADGFSDDAIKLYYLGASAANQKTKREIKEEMASEFNRQARQTGQSAALSNLNASLRQIYRQHPELKDFDASIRNKVENDYMADRTRANKWNNGVTDELALDDLVEDATDFYLAKISGNTGDGKQPKQLALKAPTGQGIQRRNTSDELKSRKTYDVDDLEDHQRQAYYDFVHSNDRYMSNKFKDENDMRKNAWEAANKLPKPSREKSVYEKRAI